MVRLASNQLLYNPVRMIQKAAASNAATIAA
jgi:hypothetical protein